MSCHSALQHYTTTFAQQVHLALLYRLFASCARLGRLLCSRQSISEALQHWNRGRIIVGMKNRIHVHNVCFCSDRPDAGMRCSFCALVQCLPASLYTHSSSSRIPIPLNSELKCMCCSGSLLALMFAGHCLGCSCCFCSSQTRSNLHVIFQALNMAICGSKYVVGKLTPHNSMP